MMKKVFTCMIFILFPLVVGAQISGSINQKNWTSHPRIKEIRKTYEETEKLISAGKLKGAKREFEYCEPYIDTEREIFINKKGRVLKYVISKGSDDSAVTESFYFDENGQLRFVYAECGAVNDTHLEVRIYLDEKGKRLWENRKLVSGPGYTFPNPWPDEELVFDPKKAFESHNKCHEIKK